MISCPSCESSNLVAIENDQVVAKQVLITNTSKYGRVQETWKWEQSGPTSKKRDVQVKCSECGFMWRAQKDLLQIR